jgi:hypothetical protein
LIDSRSNFLRDWQTPRVHEIMLAYVENQEHVNI